MEVVIDITESRIEIVSFGVGRTYSRTYVSELLRFYRRYSDQVVVLLSGLDDPVMELYILYNEVEKNLQKKGIQFTSAFRKLYIARNAGATLR